MTVEIPKKKIKKSSACADGVHTFMVTAWRTAQSKKIATMMMCRHCLVRIEMNEVSELWKQSENRAPEIKA